MTDEFDFDLPPERIALRPARPRDSARLLVVTPGSTPPLADRTVRDLPALLRRGDLLVLNDTRVVPARLTATRARGEASARVEVMLHTRAGPDRWRAFLRPGKKVLPGERLAFGDALAAEVLAKGEGGDALLAFDLSGAYLDEAVAALGTVPLPPYIAARRSADAADAADYQTVYARDPGAVAAPTAGLHLTPELLERLAVQGVEARFLTLHVGGGTFLPVKDDPDDHVMHAETGHLTAEVAEGLNAARTEGRRIVAVGTTSLRLLESALGPDDRFRPFAGETAIFLRPGTPVRAADGLLTNFHLPRSTLFMLVCAFAGTELMREAYAHAIREAYRFYSYGDASLLWRA